MAPSVTYTPEPQPAPDGFLRHPGQALDAAIDAARLASPHIVLDHGREFLALPDRFKLHDVTDPDRLPAYAEARSTVDDRASMSAFVNRFATACTVIFADLDAGQIIARLDWHSASERANDESEESSLPGPCKHSVTLALRVSEEFSRWDKVQGKLLPQAEFAAFLEENAEDISAPQPASIIEISRDLEAVQDVTFKSRTRLENGDHGFVYETETRTKGEVKVPREFVLSIPLYHGEAPLDIRCALRYRITPAGLVLGFEWRRVEYQRQAQFRELATLIADETGCPVFFGRTTK